MMWRVARPDCLALPLLELGVLAHMPQALASQPGGDPLLSSCAMTLANLVIVRGVSPCPFAWVPVVCVSWDHPGGLSPFLGAVGRCIQFPLRGQPCGGKWWANWQV